jgi:hypothetical protein
MGYIPSNYQIDWRTAGLLASTPTFGDHVFNIADETGTDDQKLDAALSKAKAATGTLIIYFPQGNYSLTNPINLKYSATPGNNGSNIIFQGEGSDKTILQFAVTRDSACFNITGQTDGGTLDLDADSFGVGPQRFHKNNALGVAKAI